LIAEARFDPLHQAGRYGFPRGLLVRAVVCEDIDRVTVANELNKNGQLESVDGVSYLVSLDDGIPEITNLETVPSLPLVLPPEATFGCTDLSVQVRDLASNDLDVTTEKAALWRDMHSYDCACTATC